MITTEGGRMIGPGWRITRPSDANYAALAIAIVYRHTVGKSLDLMGVKPSNENIGRIAKNSLRRTIGEASWVLVMICGITRKEASKAMHVSANTVSDSIKALKGEAL